MKIPVLFAVLAALAAVAVVSLREREPAAPPTPSDPESPGPLDAGRHPFALGALSVELPAGGVDATDEVLASTAVSGFRFVRWPDTARWVASASMPSVVMRPSFEAAAATDLAREEVDLDGVPATLCERDNLGGDGVSDAWGLVLFVDRAAYEVSVGFEPGDDGARAAARATILSTRVELDAPADGATDG